MFLPSQCRVVGFSYLSGYGKGGILASGIQVSAEFRQQVTPDILKVGLESPLLHKALQLHVVVSSLLIAVGHHQVFRAVDEVSQPFRRTCREIVPVSTVGRYRTTPLILQHRLTIADVGLHLVDVDGVAVGAVAGNGI